MLHDRILNKIISLQNYIDTDYPDTYISKLEYNNQNIIEIGVTHSRDPKHKNYILIKSAFEEFVKTHKSSKSVVLIENIIQKRILPKNEMVSKLGESGFLLWLANKYKIQAICPEPNQYEIIKLTSSHFDYTEEILLWIFVSLLRNLLAGDHILSHDLIEIIMKQIIKAGEIIKFKKTETEYLKIFEHQLTKITSNEISFSNKIELMNSNIDIRKLNGMLSPYLKKSLLNEVSAAINMSRDIHILSNKTNLLKKGFNIFSVFGKNHTICQEMALKEFIKLKES
ncbi:MAG: hypothetical protein NUV82_02815 [Candidatus Komeilibacteria bacterium]|nr:hypothetical protein [Candidatus Komeilibacteria bacterium]